MLVVTLVVTVSSVGLAVAVFGLPSGDVAGAMLVSVRDVLLVDRISDALMPDGPGRGCAAATRLFGCEADGTTRGARHDGTHNASRICAGRATTTRSAPELGQQHQQAAPRRGLLMGSPAPPRPGDGQARHGHCVGARITAGRVAEAAVRLTHTGDPVDQIAATVGWRDTTHFIRQLRKAYGQTPAAWRREQRSNHDRGATRH